MSIGIQNIFLIGAIIATIVFVIRVAVPMDSGTEMSGDFTSVSDMDAAFNIFTFEGICAFFMCAGWMGWFLKAFMHFTTKLSIIVAIVCGIFAILFYAFLISKIKKLEHVPTADLKELKDKIGKAYMKFAPKGQAKIEIEFNSKLEILDAVNNSETEIQSFEPIKVVDIKDNIIYIEKV